MAKHIRCKGCNTINNASAYECIKCHLDLTKRQNKIMNVKEDALEHDYAKEKIEECRCAVCAAINPREIDECLACGSSLSNAIAFSQDSSADLYQENLEESYKEVEKDVMEQITLQVQQQPQITSTKKNIRLVDVRTHEYYELENGDRILGRDEEWGYHLSKYGYVSRKHLFLRVSVDGTQMYVIETSNGTYLRKNGTLQELPTNSIVELKSGDIIGLGGEETNDLDVGIVRYEEC